MSAATRPMTTAEKYYALLDLRWPMNPIISADLDRCFPAEMVEERWRAFRRQRVLTRTVATPELCLADGGEGGHDFVAEELAEAEWDSVFDRESEVPYGFEQPMRCRYLTSADEGRSRLLVLGHHSVVDGRLGLSELQSFVRFLDGQEVPAQDVIAPIPEPATTYPWQQDRRELIDLLRTIGARNQELGDPEPRDWPDPSAPRRNRFQQWQLGRDETVQLLRAGRTHGCTALATVAAGWLTSVVLDLLGSDVAAPLQLTTPVDLGTPAAEPDRPRAMAVSVLAQRLRVDPADPWGIAREVGATVRTALDRGEAELFFHLTRVANVDDLAAGVELVAQSIATAPPAVNISNMGVIDPGTDPDWLTAMCGQLAPTPNQVVFAGVLGYRGRLVQCVSTDDNRLPPDRRSALVKSWSRQVGAMAADH